MNAPTRALLGLAGLWVAAVGTTVRAATPVEVAPVREVPVVSEVRLTGSVTAPQEAALSAQVAGLVAVIHADQGDEVAAGRVLLELDDALARLDAERAAAAVGEAEARLKEARRRFSEAKRLIADRHISPTELAAREAEVEVQAAALATERAAHRRALKLLDLHAIAAPFPAVIVRRNVGVGEWIDRDTELFEVVNLDRLRLLVRTPQEYYAEIRPGTPVDIEFDALPGRRFADVVDGVVPASSDASRTFPILVELDNRDRLLAPGMSARVAFQLSAPDAAKTLAVPRDAVIRRADGTESVWVLDESATQPTVRAIAIQTGQPIGDLVSIVRGALERDMQVVIRGNELLRPAEAVTVTRRGGGES